MISAAAIRELDGELHMSRALEWFAPPMGPTLSRGLIARPTGSTAHAVRGIRRYIATRGGTLSSRSIGLGAPIWTSPGYHRSSCGCPLSLLGRGEFPKWTRSTRTRFRFDDRFCDVLLRRSLVSARTERRQRGRCTASAVVLPFVGCLDFDRSSFWRDTCDRLEQMH